MALPVEQPFKPMLSKAVDGLPPAGEMLYEPKWDGFRCIVFRDGDSVELGSRNRRPLTRYFPELIEPIRRSFPDRCVIDGEVVVATAKGLDFDALGQRIHPADSRVTRLSVETPASFVAFDLIALGDDDLQALPFVERRARLERALADVQPPLHLTPITRDRDVATDWFRRFEGAGFDGVIAKPAGDPYVSDKRTLLKIKHHRTADVVVAGYRVHKDGNGVGSLLLGLHDDAGALHNIGVASSFSAARRVEMLDELAPYEVDGLDGHPWRDWAEAEPSESAEAATRMPGAPSRWNNSKDLTWRALRCELVAEVNYQGLTNHRLRHPASFVRWRPDKMPEECRYDQLEQIAPQELAEMFAQS